MLYVFSINRVKLVARKPETTNNMGQREYEVSRALTETTNLLNPKEQLTRGFLKKLLRAVDRD